MNDNVWKSSHGIQERADEVWNSSDEVGGSLGRTGSSLMRCGRDLMRSGRDLMRSRKGLMRSEIVILIARARKNREHYLINHHDPLGCPKISTGL